MSSEAETLSALDFPAAQQCEVLIECRKHGIDRCPATATWSGRVLDAEGVLRGLVLVCTKHHDYVVHNPEDLFEANLSMDWTPL